MRLKRDISGPLLWLLDPNPAGLVLFLTLLALLVAVVAMVTPARAETPVNASVDSEAFQASTEADAVAMIKHWIRLTPRHPMANAKRQERFARLQVAATEVHQTPLSLTMSIMFKESSGRPGVVGALGEIGLMQVHPATSRRFKCSMGKPFGQLMCGHKVLRYWFDKCGTWRGALTAYAGKYGRCEAKPGSNLARVVRSRFKLAAELEAVAGR
jgi:soluble lytic murein transglycosylase-like protein